MYEVKRAHLIVNPFSGKKKGDDVGRFVSEELSASKIVVKTYRTEGPEAAIPIVQDLTLESGDIIVTVGGDGTFCEVITGFLSRSDSANDRFPLALIPAGTGNSQANDMEIFSHMDAVQLILKNRLRKMDIAKVTFN